MNGAGQVGLYKSSTTLGAILDISAPGALSTDIAFRVRNSADNATFFTVRGDQAIEIIRESPSTNGGILISKEDAYNNSSIKFYDAFGTLGIYIDNSLSEIRAGNIKTYYGNSNTYLGLVNTGTTTRSLKSVDAFSNQYLDLTTDLFNGGATFWMRPITNNNTVYAQWRGYGALNKISITDQANFSVGGETWGTSSKYVISQFTGTAPASSVTDGFQQYSADITAGNAAPHFRTEDGSVIKLYQQGAVSSSQGIADVLTNLGLLSGSSVVVDVSGSGNAFPYTGSAQITGSLIINNALSTAIQTTLNAGSNTVYTLPTASYDTAFFEYSIRSGSNARAGSIMAIQSDNTVNFTETTTTNFGDTSGVTFTVIVSGADIALTGSATTGPWTTKLIVRGI
jgi:hypothetical protein